MLRPVSLLRSSTRLAVLIPFALAAACGDDASPDDANDGGTATAVDSGVARNDGAADAASLGDNAATDGAATDGAATDGAAPTIVASSPGNPAAAGTGAARTTSVVATFSKPMTEATVVSAFSLSSGGVPVPGTVTYFDGTATLLPNVKLALDTRYTATITTAATDATGNGLAATYTWSFTTETTAPLGPAPLVLGTASSYVVLAKTAITNVPTSAITGNVGISPAAASYITGFSMTKAASKWTSLQVDGSIFAADNDAPTPTNLTTAINDLMTAYTDGENRPNPTYLNRDSGTLTTLPLPPGLYKWGSAVSIPQDINIVGAANDVWIFQITGNLTMSAATKMRLSGGAAPKNIFWQVAGLVSMGNTSHAEGIVLSKTMINLGTGASVNGRLFAQTAVTLASNTITAPAP